MPYILVICLLIFTSCGKQGSVPLEVTSSGVNYGELAVEDDVDKYPGVVALAMKYRTWGGEKFDSFCTGFIINESLIGTAAHCVSTIRDTSAIHIIEGGSVSKPKASHQVAYCISNPKFIQYNYREMASGTVQINDKGSGQDYAFCQLKNKLSLTSDQVIPFISADELKTLNNASVYTSVGYGLDERSNSGVKKYMQSTRVRKQPFQSVITMFDVEDGVRINSGDSGGPTFVTLPNGELRIHSIHSAGSSYQYINTNVGLLNDFLMTVSIAIDVQDPKVQNDTEKLEQYTGILLQLVRNNATNAFAMDLLVDTYKKLGQYDEGLYILQLMKRYEGPYFQRNDSISELEELVSQN